MCLSQVQGDGSHLGGIPPERDDVNFRLRRAEVVSSSNVPAGGYTALFVLVAALPRIGFIANFVWANVLEQRANKLRYNVLTQHDEVALIKRHIPLVEAIAISSFPTMFKSLFWFELASGICVLSAYTTTVKLERKLANLEISWLDREQLSEAPNREAKMYRVMLLVKASLPMLGPWDYFQFKSDAKEWLKEKSKRPGTVHHSPIRDTAKEEVIERDIQRTRYSIAGSCIQITVAKVAILSNRYTAYEKPLFIVMLSMMIYSFYLLYINRINKQTLVKCRQEGLGFKRARLL